MPPKSWEVSQPQPDSPQMSASPLEALLPNPVYQQSFLAQYGYPLLGGFGGFSAAFLSNYLNKRPYYSNLILFPILTIAGGVSLFALQKYKENQWAERDAIFRHYISLHPEEFPPYKREKFGEVFGDWTPIR